MTLVSQILVAIIALQHLAFLVLEMFLWDKPVGRAVFRLSPERAAATKVLAANQGLYNGFLAAGLIWSLVAGEYSLALAWFFLGCVLVAGIYGGVTAGRMIWVVQALPAALALITLLL